MASEGATVDRNPQGLRQDWQDLGFTKTQAVVLELVLRMEDKGQNHVVWIDNLFTTLELLSYLRKNHVGAAGTVRTGRTKREIKENPRLLQPSQPPPPSRPPRPVKVLRPSQPLEEDQLLG
jgi:Transposase IS4